VDPVFVTCGRITGGPSSGEPVRAVTASHNKRSIKGTISRISRVSKLAPVDISPFKDDGRVFKDLF
jgi:hypothetical protein